VRKKIGPSKQRELLAGALALVEQLLVEIEPGKQELERRLEHAEELALKAGKTDGAAAFMAKRTSTLEAAGILIDSLAETLAELDLISFVCDGDRRVPIMSGRAEIIAGLETRWSDHMERAREDRLGTGGERRASRAVDEELAQAILPSTSSAAS
jgi:hypothetical protein